MMVQQQYPIRYGIVPICDDGENTGNNNDASTVEVGGNGEIVDSAVTDKEFLARDATQKDVCSLFYVVREKYSNTVAVDFLSSIAMFSVEKAQKKQQLQQVMWVVYWCRGL